MSAADDGVNYLDSWKDAKDPSDPPPIRTCDADGSVHFSQLKRIGDSGKQYLEALRHGGRSSPAQMLGTAVHTMVLGARPGESIARYSGRRAGKEWEAFEAAHVGATILNDAEWSKAEAAAAAVLADPVAREHMAGARFEVPLRWDENGVLCSTSGVDIVSPTRIGDLKTAATTHIDRFQKQAFGFSYHAQLAFYARGARANGLDISGGLFVIAVEMCPPHEVVVHELAEDLIDLGDRTVTLWLERYRAYRDSDQWPGRAQSAVVWSTPTWMHSSDDEEEAA